MPNTPNRGYYHPSTSTNATIPAHMKEALEAVDADVQRLYDEQLRGYGITAIRMMTKEEYESISPHPTTLYLVSAPTGVGGEDPDPGPGLLDGTLAAPDFGTPVAVGSGTASSATITIPRPDDISTGDLLVIALRSQDGAGTAVWSAPTGLTRITPAVSPLPSSAGRIAAIFVKRVVNLGWEPESYTFTGPVGRNVGIAVACNVGPTSTINPVGTNMYGGFITGSRASELPASTLTSAPGLSLLAMGAECTPGTSHVPTSIPSGFTTVVSTQSTTNSSTTGSRTALWLGWRAELDATIETMIGEFPEGAAGAGVYLGTFKVSG